MRDSFKSIDQLIKSIEELPRKSATLLIGIDGCGGSGKSTIAKRLQSTFSNASVLHMDDFYRPKKERVNLPVLKKPIGADCDWERVLQQVVQPLTQNQKGRYQRYDWDTDTLAEWHTVPTGGIVIVEGVYSLREELRNYYDFTIWVNCPREIRLTRGLERDGEEARDIWVNEWMVAEELYVEKHKPGEFADLIIKGTE